MARKWWALPKDRQGTVPCMWKKECQNAATHVDERTSKTICVPCYEEHIGSKEKGHAVSAAVAEAMKLAEDKALRIVEGQKIQVSANGKSRKQKLQGSAKGGGK